MRRSLAVFQTFFFSGFLALGSLDLSRRSAVGGRTRVAGFPFSGRAPRTFDGFRAGIRTRNADRALHSPAAFPGSAPV